MAKNKGKARVRVVLEHKTTYSSYRYHTSKNWLTTLKKLMLKKYSPLTKKHELFKEIK